jgi:NTE family protein
MIKPSLGGDSLDMAVSAEPIKSEPAGIGICLSGGGFRAMLFHVGALWRLNEMGLLAPAARISSVSGGSITAGWLALLWARKGWKDAHIPQDDLRGEFASGLCRLASRTIDIPSILLGFLPWSNVGRRIASAYDRALFGGATLQQIPEAPRFVFNASNLQSGALWRFSKPYMGDYKVGLVSKPLLKLATAVAASSAFPPFLSPFKLRLSGQVFEQTGKETLQREPFTTCPILSDGGVYDNLGVETVFKRCSTVFVSDGGAPFKEQEWPASFWPTQLKRVLNCIDNQVRSLRKREIIDGLNSGQKHGAYWGIGTPLDRYPRKIPLACSTQTTLRLACTPTRLARMSNRLQWELINWGYAACSASLASYFPQVGPAASWPCPSCALE